MKRPSSKPSAKRPGNPLIFRLLLAAALLFLVLLAYWPALHAGFIWDDDRYVTDNAMLTAPDGLRQIWFSPHKQSQYFPLVYTTFRLERQLWGLAPLGYHLVNVLLHGINALLVWAVLRRLAVPGAWLAAAIFALHPVHVESVAWVTELKNIESLFFSLLAVLAWMRFTKGSPWSTPELDSHRNANRITEPHKPDKASPPVPAPLAPSWVFYALSLLAYLLALFAKTTACTLPAALVLVLWLRRERFNWVRAVQVLPYVLIGLAMGLVSVFWEKHLGNYDPSFQLSTSALERLLISARAYWFYAGKLVWPTGLAFSYPRWNMDPHQALNYLWLLACLLVVVGLVLLRHRPWWRGLAAGVAFFVATLSPLAGWIPNFTFLFSFVADHYQYVASLGLIALVPAAFSLLGKAAGYRVWPSIASGVLLLLLGVLTYRQSAAYYDSESLWRDTIAKNPRSWMGHTNLGSALENKGRLLEAREQYEVSLQLNPNDFIAAASLGNVLSMLNRRPEAMQYYRRALQINPKYALAHANLGMALLADLNYAEAISHLRQALDADPEFHQVLLYLGDALRDSGQIPEAVEYYRKAAAALPDQPEPLLRLAGILQSKGENEQAIALLRQACAISANRADLWLALGNAQFQQSHFPDAAESFRRATVAEPANPLAHYDLGLALAAQGKMPEARTEFETALRLKPDLQTAREQLLRLNAPRAN
jgi:protein O-mannosyl-transferase